MITTPDEQTQPNPVLSSCLCSRSLADVGTRIGLGFLYEACRAETWFFELVDLVSAINRVAACLVFALSVLLALADLCCCPCRFAGAQADSDVAARIHAQRGERRDAARPRD
jgi:hypothetical protein